MATKPSIPKGTRDFSPQEMLRRKYIFSTIEKVFQKYGFLPLETPAMENLETLTGKYGEEGDRLIFKILNSGDAWDGVSDNVKEKLKAGEPVHPGRVASELAEKALRYDLTVPFARYVVQHQSELAFPFKRYQIQPVWRADRPQKGRYREFYQCDADVIGSKGLLNEAELVALMAEVFRSLGLKVKLLVNNRKVLAGMVKLFNVEDRMIEFITVLDKHDKVGRDGVIAEYRRRGFPNEVVDDIDTFMREADNDSHGAAQVLLSRFKEREVEIGILGMEETVRMLWAAKSLMGIEDWKPEFIVSHDLTLARGLDYYTGAIFEVKAEEGSLTSSICGGGRYDDLTGVFGLKGMSGVGISFGADRIYDVLLEAGKFPTGSADTTRVLIASPSQEDQVNSAVTEFSLRVLREVRGAGISAEIYPEFAKLPKQFAYAEKKGIPYVGIVGSIETNEGKVKLKKLGANEEGTTMSIEEVIDLLSR